MKNLFDRAEEKGRAVAKTLRSKANERFGVSVIVKSSGTNTEKNRKKRAAKKKRKLEEAEKLFIANRLEEARLRLEEARLRKIKRYDALDLGITDKKTVTFEDYVTVEGEIDEVITTLKNLKEKYRGKYKGCEIEIREIRTGYEDWYMAAVITRLETNTEYMERKNMEEAERLEKEEKRAAEKAEALAKKNARIIALENELKILKKK